MQSTDTRVPLEFTLVLYDEESLVSYCMALLTFAPLLLLVALFTAFVVRREIAIGYWGFGCLVSTAVNRTIKKAIKEPRPEGSANTGYGMPSDHSQMMAFLAVYFGLWLWLQVKLDRPALKLPAYLVAAALAVLVPVSRVVLGVHTVQQVVAGSLIGTVLAMSWYHAGVIYARLLLFPWLEHSPLGRACYLKDSSTIENVLKAEYLLSRRIRGFEEKTL
jgi:dolichyldiphosphatase